MVQKADKNITGQTYLFPANAGKVGATAGVTTNVDTGNIVFPASGTADTFTIPIVGLKVGDVITAFRVYGQLESAANQVTLDCDLRYTTAGTAALTDTSIQTMTQVDKTADYLINESTALTTFHTVASLNSYYLLCTVTAGASANIDLQGVEVTVTEN